MKYLGGAVTFSEFPDEIAYCINITNCPCNCIGCSEPELKGDLGVELTEDVLLTIITKNPGITMIGFLGGDCDHEAICNFANFIHTKNLKVGFYSGFDSMNLELLNVLDYYKIGSWIQPQGKVEDWWRTNCGPICFPFSNQLMFKRENGIWENITYKFRKEPLNDLTKKII